MVLRFSKFSGLSVYTHGEAHLLQKTYHGAVVTVLGVVLAAILFVSELQSCMHVTTVQEMDVDESRGDYLQLRLNITMHALPCQALNIDLRDITGVRKSDVALARGGGLHKMRLDRWGRALGSEYVYPGHSVDFFSLARDREIVAALEDALESHEGCNIYGLILVQRVAGTLVVGIHLEDFFGLPENMMRLRDAMRRAQKHTEPEPHPDAGIEVDLDTTRVNVSHTIHDLSFGQDMPGTVKPLKGVVRREDDIGGSQGGLFRYYLKIVPTELRKLSGRMYRTYQYSVTEYYASHQKGSGKVPGLYFVYDLSPLEIHLREERKGLSHLAVRFCAVVGGVFAVTGMIDRWVHRLATATMQQQRPKPRPQVQQSGSHYSFNTANSYSRQY